MNKIINQRLCSIFMRDFLALNLGFDLKTVKQQDVKGGVVFERRVDRMRAAWIVFGGSSEHDRSLSLYGAWTIEGARYSDLPLVWLGDRPIPVGGRFDALLSKQFSASPTVFDGGRKFVEIERPGISLQERALEGYFASPKFQDYIEKVLAAESHRKNPPSRSQVESDERQAERLFMEQWQHMVTRIEVTQDLIEPHARAALDAILLHLRTTVVPWLAGQV